jgi:AcrR family transcriptional regulator
MSNMGRRRAAALHQDAEAYSRRRKDVVEAAARLFRKNGYASTSLNDVAEELGTDRATIYYYIASKKELLLEVVRDSVESVAKGALGIKQSSDAPPIKLHKLIVALMRSYEENYPHQFVYIQEGLAVSKGDDAHLFQMGQQYERSLVAIIAEGLEDGSFRPGGDAKVIAYGILGALNWTHRWMNPRGRLSPEEVAETFSEMFLQGLLPRAARK